MSDARDIFSKGDKVIATQEAYDNGVVTKKMNGCGTVVGFSRCGRYVRVRPDGMEKCGKYSTVFWSKAEGGPEKI